MKRVSEQPLAKCKGGSLSIRKRRWRAWLLTAFVAFAGASARSDGAAGASDGLMVGEEIATGKSITPTAAQGAIFQDLETNVADQNLYADHAAAVSASPDGRILAILTSGNNQHYDSVGKPIPELSNEYIFLFDISKPTPSKTQVLMVRNAYQGIAWAPSSHQLYVSGGKDDEVVEFTFNGRVFQQSRVFRLAHTVGVGLNAPVGLSSGVEPIAGALAVNPRGTRLLVANYQNDSVSLVDLASGRIVVEKDLRPGKIDPKFHGMPGGSFPRSIVWTSDDHAYVASERDREIISLSITSNTIGIGRRLRVGGQPVALVANRRVPRIYAALDNTDKIAVVDTKDNKVIEEIGVLAPQSIYLNKDRLGGANSNALALTPDGQFLLVSNGGQNAVAVVRLGELARDEGSTEASTSVGDGDVDEHGATAHSEVVGLVPTGWYPTGVATSANGATWYIVNAKSNPGPNAGWCRLLGANGTCTVKAVQEMNFAPNGQGFLRTQDQTLIQLQRAGFLSVPTPSPRELERLTRQVARNNGFDRPHKSAADERLFDLLRRHIKHVIYVIKENRTYDQVLGDLEVGNGDPRLAIFGRQTTPNQHALARQFVALDNFLLSGEGSWTGWQWSVAGRTNDVAERNDVLDLARHATISYYYGANRGINTAYATSKERIVREPKSPADPDVLPGVRDIAELDGPGGLEGKGYIWDSVLRAGLSVRNYGFFTTLPSDAPIERDPYSKELKQAVSTNTSLIPYTDPYFRPLDFLVPDFWRFREWKREFDAYSASGHAPSLMQVWFGSNHTGNFDKIIDGVNTPETQVADNDYAFGLLVEAVAKSPFADDTLLISVEDDTWDGPDHVNAFRSPIFIAGPYVRRGAVISTRYTTANVLKTIEEILGIEPVCLNDAFAAPMSDIFDPSVPTWSYKAIVPDVLRSTKLPLPPTDHASNAVPTHSAAYWTKVMAGQDFSGPDRGDPVTFNRALWRGLKGDTPYPAARAAADLRENRARLLGKTPTDRDDKGS